MKYVAVVGANRPSRAYTAGDWACFVGEDETEVVEQALNARSKWGTKDYVIWVGTLTHEAKTPRNFKLVILG